MSNSNLKEKIESKLKNYIHKFVRYAGYSHLSIERKELVAGTFAYLLEDYDLIPDDVPNIGYLDDLMVFVEASKHFINTGTPVAGVCNPDEIMADNQFVKQHAGLMFGNQHFSLDTIRNLGKKHVAELSSLATQISEKYKDLGGSN